MCGRYTQRKTEAELRARFQTEPVDERAIAPRYNAAPTNVMPVVRVEDDGRRHLRLLRWGLVPWFAKSIDDGARAINARVETLAEKPTFRDALLKRRCLVPTDGFYEWSGSGKAKQAWWFHRDDDALFAFGGLWALWRGPSGPVETFTIITTDANALTAPIHDRMPLIVDEEDWRAWLDPARAELDVMRMAAPRAIEHLVLSPVGARVGNVRYDDPTLVLPEPRLL